MARVHTHLLVLTLSAGTADLAAQCVNGTRTYPIYKAGATKVLEIDEAEKEVVHIEYDLIFDSKQMYRVLSTDWEYTITAFADDGVEDLDLAVFVYDDLVEDWMEVAVDSTSYGDPMIIFTPTEGVEHMVRLTLNSFKEGYTAARYGLMIYHD